MSREAARPSPAALIARIRAGLRSRPDPVLLIGGASGAGKSTFAALAHAALGGTAVTMEDLYRGWDGLDAGSGLLAGLLADRAASRTAAFRPWDWTTGCRAPSTRRLPATGLLIVEGGGAVTPASVRFADVTVVLDVPAAVRIRRTMLRDPAETHRLLAAWEVQERRAAAMHGCPAALVVRGGVAPGPRYEAARGNTLRA